MAFGTSNYESYKASDGTIKRRLKAGASATQAPVAPKKTVQTQQKQFNLKKSEPKVVAPQNSTPQKLPQNGNLRGGDTRQPKITSTPQEQRKQLPRKQEKQPAPKAVDTKKDNSSFDYKTALQEHLKSKGIEGNTQTKIWFANKFGNDSEKLKEYLKNGVKDTPQSQISQGTQQQSQSQQPNDNFKPVSSYQDWIQRGKKPTELVDYVETKYGIDAEYDPKTNTITGRDEEGNEVKSWSFDKGGFAIKEDNPLLKSQQYVAKFSEMLNSGVDHQQIKDYLLSDQNLFSKNKKEMSGMYKEYLKNKRVMDTQKKYDTASGQNLYDAVKRGELAPGGEEWNALNPETQARYDKANRDNLKVDLLINSTTEDSISVVADVDSDDDFDKVMANVHKYLSSGYVELLEEKRNAPEYQKIVNSQGDKLKNIRAQELKIKNAERDLRKRFPTASEQLIQKLLVKEKEGLVDSLARDIDDYNVDRGVLQDMKNDIQDDMSALQLDNETEFRFYNSALTQYNQNRAITREQDRFELIEKNKILAEERAETRQLKLMEVTQRINQENSKFNQGLNQENATFNQGMSKDMAKFQQELGESSMAGGTYKDDGKGNLVYMKNGKQLTVLEGMGEKISEGYGFKTYKNEVGGYDVVGVDEKTGKTKIRSFDMTGTPVGSYTKQLGNGVVTQYGGRVKGDYGLDIAGDVGDAVFMPFSGEVVDTGESKIFGKWMTVKNPATGDTVRYAHLNKLNIGKGDVFTAGDEIAELGNTGFVLSRNYKNGTEQVPQNMRSKGWGAHLDITSWDSKGNVRSARATETALNGFSQASREGTGNYSDQDLALAKSISEGSVDIGRVSQKNTAQINFLVQGMINEKIKGKSDGEAMIIKSAMYKKDISDGATEDIEKIETVKWQLKNLASSLEKTGSDPIMGLIQKWNPYDSESQQVLAQITGLTPSVARGIFGEVGVLTDFDIKNYQKVIPSLTSTEEKNALAMKFMNDLLTTTYINKLETLAKSRRNVSNYLPDYQEMKTVQAKNQGSGVVEGTSGFTFDLNTHKVIESKLEVYEAEQMSSNSTKGVFGGIKYVEDKGQQNDSSYSGIDLGEDTTLESGAGSLQNY